MTKDMPEAQLQAIVAKAYAAIADPHSMIDLLDDMDEAEGGSGRFGEEAELHFNNAVNILETMYPIDKGDFSALNTQQSSDFACDLALDSKLRIVSVNSRIFEDGSLVYGQFAAEWIFNPATGSADRKRLSDFGPQDDGAFFRLHVSAGDDTGRWFVARTRTSGGEWIITFHVVRLRWSERSGAAFQKALRLTSTEVALVRHIVTGGKVREFAEMRGRAVGTARNQLKNLQRKLSINSKEDLLLLYAGFVHSLELPGDQQEVAIHQCPNHFNAASDCRIAWEEHGDPGGKPVLFFHPLEGALLPPRVVSAALAQGLRIIAPWRPNYGETTDMGRGFASVSQFADRLPGLLDHLGIDQCAALGAHAGSTYMMAFAQAHPDRLLKVIGAGAFLPVTGASDFAHMRRRHAIQMRLARMAPAFARIYQRAMLATIGTGEFYRFVEEFYQGCAREMESMRDPDMLDMLRRSATYTLHNNSLSTGETMVIWASDWSRFCADISVPVQMLYGREDANTSTDFARLSCERFGFRNPIFADDAGSFLLQDQPAWVMENIASVFG